jgi:hypothetical protein
MSKELYVQIGEQFKEQYDSEMGQMFGKPCFKINKKAFAAFFKDEMVFKLGREDIYQVRDQYFGSVNWDPSGKDRPMKDWLQIPLEYAADWNNLAKQAMDFVEQ